MPSPLSPADRHTSGQNKRKLLPRSQHGQWNRKLRHRSPLELLRQSMRGRLERLFPLRYQLMAASPFGFFRGAVPVMAYDLSLLPHTGVITQLCGDAHVRNLGAYAGVDGQLVFDINDFDETIRGPFEWDLKRLVTSVLLAGEAVKLKPAVSRNAAAELLDRYRKSIRTFASMPVLDLARFPVRRLNHVSAVSEILERAERATPQHSLDTLTEPVQAASAKKDTRKSHHPDPEALSYGLGRRFHSHPPSLERLTGHAADAVLASLSPYRESLLPERRHFLDQYRPVDVAFKVVGTGSVGLRDFCVMFEGNGPEDPLFLQIKEEVASAWAPYLPNAPKTPAHQGHRVVDGQRAMQLQSDIFLGWTRMNSRDFLVRQLNDHKGSLDLDTLSPEQLVGFADLAGELLARGHARAGDPAALAGYIGKSDRFDEAILQFAQSYAEQTESDWKHFVRAKHF